MTLLPLTAGRTFDATRPGWWRWVWVVHRPNRIGFIDGKRVTYGSKPLVSIPLSRWHRKP